MKFTKSLLALSIIALASCSDSDDDTKPTTLTGFFIDSAVQGLSYNSASTSGTTGADGSFDYVEGESITFSVGGLALGSTVGNNYVTPINLIQGANTSNVSVINIVRLLLMLDSDGDSSNGITISTEVQAVAAAWAAIDFSDQAIDTLLDAFLADVEMADSRNAVLTTAQNAQSHMELSYACLASGVYPGTYSGDGSGTFVLLVEPQRIDSVAFGNNTPRTGVTSVGVFDQEEDELLISGFSTGLTFDQSLGVIAGSLEEAQYSGSLTDFNALSGDWRNDTYGDIGTFTGERLGGDPSAIHRLSGIFLTANVIPDVDNFGYIALDVFADNTSTGYIVVVDGTKIALSGNYSAETGKINVSGEDMVLDVNFDPVGGILVQGGIPSFAGLWQGRGATGGIGGFSCQLNNP